MKLLFRVVVLAACSGTVRALPVEPAQAEIVPAFLLIGQSNMEGLALPGELSGGPYAAYLEPQNSVRLYNRYDCAQDCEPGTVATTWKVLHAGTNTSPCFPGSMGPEVSLGKSLAGLYGRRVYLVKYGVGATWLSSPGKPAERSWNVANGCLWSNALEHLEAARAALPPGKILRVDGIFWAQGVFDTGNANSATAYETELTNLIETLRTELVARSFTFDSTVPFVISQVPDFVIANFAPDPRYFDTVRCAQQRVACTLPDVGIYDPIDADGAGSPFDDPYHMDAEDQIVHGLGLFDAFAALSCPALSIAGCTLLSVGDPASSVTFHVRSPGNASRPFLLLGSTEGNQPGFPIGAQTLHLGGGTHFLETANLVSSTLSYESPPAPGALPLLDAAGEALVTFTPVAGIAAGRYHHAFVVFEQDGGHDVSNTVSLTVYP